MYCRATQHHVSPQICQLRFFGTVISSSLRIIQAPRIFVVVAGRILVTNVSGPAIAVTMSSQTDTGEQRVIPYILEIETTGLISRNTTQLLMPIIKRKNIALIETCHRADLHFPILLTLPPREQVPIMPHNSTVFSCCCTPEFRLITTIFPLVSHWM